MLKKRNGKIKIILLVITVIIIYALASKSSLVEQYSKNPEELKSLILGFGVLAPLAIIILQFFQTTISLIPSQITTVVAGFVFGPFWGLVYSLIGAFFGSMFVFFLARKFGRKLALKLFDKRDLIHFNLLLKQKKKLALFLARMAPIFPNDLVSFGAGLTDMKLRNFNLISTAGFIVQMVILTYFGSELSTGKLSLPLIIVMVVISLLILIAIFEKQIKKILIKDLHKLEKKVKSDIYHIENK